MVGTCTRYIQSGHAHEGTYTGKGHTHSTYGADIYMIGDTHGGGIYLVQTVWISEQKNKKMRSYT